MDLQRLPLEVADILCPALSPVGRPYQVPRRIVLILLLCLPQGVYDRRHLSHVVILVTGTGAVVQLVRLPFSS